MPRQPNIVWILCTQWRAQATGFAGDPNAKTPCLDAFAERAICYTQAITPHPFGPFARAALLTGIPSPENGVCDYYDPLPPNSRTIATELNEAGYETAFFGKWHLSPRDPKAALVGETHAKQPVPADFRGDFSHWEGFESGFQLNDPWLQGDGIGEPTRYEGYQSDILCARSADWLSKRPSTGKPGFCVVSLEAPHPPYGASAAGVQPPDPASLILQANVPCGGEVEARARAELAGYYAHIQATDRAIGKLLEHPALRDAVIIFTSVHGDMHGAHGLFRKGWPYEESIRIPLLIQLPPGTRRFQFGHATTDLVTLLDVHGWTRRLAGIEDAGRRTERLLQCCSMPSVVKLPLQCDRAWKAYRTGMRKLVLNADGSPWLYFDLEKDPLETRNLVGQPESDLELIEFLHDCEAHLAGK